jgi:hypothetical protein
LLLLLRTGQRKGYINRLKNVVKIDQMTRSQLADQLIGIQTGRTKKLKNRQQERPVDTKKD